MVNHKKEELDKTIQSQIKTLEKVAGMSADEAKAQMIEALKDEARSQAMAMAKDIVDEAKLTASKDAKKIVIQTQAPDQPSLSHKMEAKVRSN